MWRSLETKAEVTATGPLNETEVMTEMCDSHSIHNEASTG